MKHREQIELITCGHSTIVHFRDILEAISHSYGRIYANPTLSSLQRIVKLMNDHREMTLEVKLEGKSVSIVGWKKEKIYIPEDWYDPWG